jgi:choice-of-anchor B domain-containing protein
LKLLTIDSKNPVTFDNAKDLTGHYDKLPSGRSHNVVVNPDSDIVYIVGAVPRNDRCRSGLIYLNLTDPSAPWSPGCASNDGYVHDAQVVIYKGPHKKYYNHEIAFAFNENSMTFYDLANKRSPKIISRTSYDGAAYVHQGWLLNEKMEYLISDDELDEMQHAGFAADGVPVTFIWDIRNLEHPKQTGHIKGTVRAVDHNQYIHDMKSYQSNYGAGFRILDLSSIPEDPTGGGVEELGFFDIYPEDDLEVGGGKSEFLGTWSSYAYFKSGYIFVNTIERGGFVIKYRE